MPTRMGGDRGRRLLRLAVQIVLTGVVTWFIVDRVGVDFSRLARFEVGGWHLRWHWLALSILTLGAGYVLSALLWGRMVVELGGPRVPPARATRIFLVANLGRYVPGKVLQLAGLTLLAAREGVRPTTAAVSAILGQGVALLGATLIGLAAFFAPESGMRTEGWVGVGAVGVFLVLGSLPAARRILATLWARFAKNDPTDPPPALADPVFVWRWTVFYAVNWALYATGFWLLFIGVVGHATFLQAGPAFAAAYVGGYLALFAPAGLGIRESLLTVFLTPLVTPERALALAVIARLWTTLVEVVPALALAPRTLKGLGRAPEIPPEGTQ